MSHDHREGSREADRDGEVQREWRRTSVEQPPSSIDAALIAAARKAVEHRPAVLSDATTRGQSRSWWTRWQPLAAAAAVAGIAFVLVPLLPRDHPLAPADQQPASAILQSDVTAERPATSAAPAESANESTLASPSSEAPAGAVEQRALPTGRQESAGRREIPQTRPQDAPAPPAVDKRASDASEVRPSSRLLGSETSAAMSAPMTDKAVTGEMQSRDPAAWIAQITTLHDTGDLAGAAEALRAFRTAYPDADTRLPQSLRAWARTVR